MRTDRRDELAKKIQRGSQIKPPRRCPRCLNVVKHDEGSAFCSSNCEEAARVEVAQATLRAEVLERDHGVCALCNTDCLWLREYLDELLEVGTIASIQRLDAYARGLKGWPKAPLHELGATLWQADHITERAAGGASTPDQMQTTCLGCHAEKTKGFAKRRAAARRPFGGRR